MAGPTPFGALTLVSGGLQRFASPQILSVGVSSQYFDVDFIEESEGESSGSFLLLLPPALSRIRDMDMKYNLKIEL